MMRKLFVVLLISLLFVLSGCKTETFIDDGIDKNTIEVTILNDEEYNVTGEIVYHVNYDLDELYLMMFANTHYEGNDRVTINHLSINNKEVDFEFDGLDKSAINITLNEDISNGDIVCIQYDMDVVYPDTFRLANYGDMLYQMYFYPFVAVYNDGFDIDPYASVGETYYNTLYDYDVTIVIDDAFIVSAPGELVSTTPKDNKIAYRYVLENARDFSFSASTYYQVYEWEDMDMQFGIYSIRELTEEELVLTKEYVRKSFEVYESYIGEYYYDRFILELGYIYGMESTGIIYCSEEISETTIVHEVIHQWFFFMIGNDSYNDSFLDESLTTYLTALYYYDLYGLEGYDGYLDYRDSSQERLVEYWELYEGTSLLVTPDEMQDGYAFVIYYHGPSLFREYVYQYLDNDVDEFARILSVYYEQYQGDIATIDEFLTLLEEESGVEGTKEWFYFHLNNLQEVTNTP